MLSFARTRFYHEWKLKELAFREYARRENLRRYNRQRGFIINPYSFGAAPSDPSFANVVSLAHFDDSGAGGFTGPFVDQIANRSPGWTRHAVGAHTDNSIVKYGTCSLANGAVGVYNADHVDWDFPADFCLEFWFYPVSLTGPLGGAAVFLVSKGDTATFRPYVIFLNSGVPNCFSSLDGSSWGVTITAAGSVSINTWYFLRYNRQGNDFKGFLDGAQIGSTVTTAGALMTNALTVTLGSDSTSALATSYQGNFDDWRATKGDSRSASNGTAPIAAFPDS